MGEFQEVKWSGTGPLLLSWAYWIVFKHWTLWDSLWKLLSILTLGWVRKTEIKEQRHCFQPRVSQTELALCVCYYSEGFWPPHSFITSSMLYIGNAVSFNAVFQLYVENKKLITMTEFSRRCFKIEAYYWGKKRMPFISLWAARTSLDYITCIFDYTDNIFSHHKGEKLVIWHYAGC